MVLRRTLSDRKSEAFRPNARVWRDLEGLAVLSGTVFRVRCIASLEVGLFEKPESNVSIKWMLACKLYATLTQSLSDICAFIGRHRLLLRIIWCWFAGRNQHHFVFLRERDAFLALHKVVFVRVDTDGFSRLLLNEDHFLLRFGVCADLTYHTNCGLNRIRYNLMLFMR